MESATLYLAPPIMKFTTATPAPVEKITIVIKDQTISSKEMIVVRHSWTHPNDREIKRGVLDARYDLQQSSWNYSDTYTVTGTRADFERLKVELDSAYGLTAPEVEQNA